MRFSISVNGYMNIVITLDMSERISTWMSIIEYGQYEICVSVFITLCVGFMMAICSVSILEDIKQGFYYLIF